MFFTSALRWRKKILSCPFFMPGNKTDSEDYIFLTAGNIVSTMSKKTALQNTPLNQALIL